MPDGVKLAADLYMPAGEAKGTTFPVILEYLPNRKTESRARNHALNSYFVERGYVVARVDIRGTGNSEGRLSPNEYSEQEHEDGMVVSDWLVGHGLGAESETVASLHLALGAKKLFDYAQKNQKGCIELIEFFVVCAILIWDQPWKRRLNDGNSKTGSEKSGSKTSREKDHVSEEGGREETCRQETCRQETRRQETRCQETRRSEEACCQEACCQETCS